MLLECGETKKQFEVHMRCHRGSPAAGAAMPAQTIQSAVALTNAMRKPAPLHFRKGRCTWPALDRSQAPCCSERRQQH